MRMPHDTARLRFERAAAAHAPLLHALHADSEVMRFIRPPDATLADTQVWVAELLTFFAQMPEHGLYLAFEKEGGAFVGWGVLTHLERNSTLEIEVGYRLHQAHWGKGYATEISRELVRYGFEELGLRRIVAITHPENKRSQRVIEKLGMRSEGERVYYRTPVLYYALER